MKIGPLSDTRVAGTSSGVSKAGQNTPAAAASSAPVSAPASTSGVPVTVSNLAQVMEQSGKVPDIDMAKVESVRTAIANGTFKPNPEAIADKLIANARELFKRDSH